MILSLVVFLLILTVLVLIHEAGHYFVAKKFGIKVEEFGFGLPPRAFGIKKGETIYSINWLPIGGFVKLYGEDEAGSGKVTISQAKKVVSEDKDINRAFYARPAWQRSLVVVAGVVMNTLLAIVIYYVFMLISNFQTELPMFGSFHFFGANQSISSAIVVSQVIKNAPAEKIGLTPGSELISINGQTKLNAEKFRDIIQTNRGKSITISWKETPNSSVRTATIIPRINPPKDQGAIGVAFFSSDTVKLSYDTPIQKLFSGIIHPINLLLYNFAVMAQLVAISVQHHTAAPISQGVAGPVGIYSLVGTIIQIPDIKERILQLLNLAGLLSISLAFFNILPIPALDGGRFFFILIELIFHKKISPKIEGYAHAVGMAVLLLLILLVTIKDIGQLIIK